MIILTQEKLKKLLNYNPDTGDFIWKIDRGKAMEGDIAGYIDKHTGYRIIVINRKRYKASRLVFLYMQGQFPSDKVKHKNNIKDDNRFCNLYKTNELIDNLNLDIPYDKTILNALKEADLL